jgi:type I site-specific restriction-modification system R (restriction) subunit
MKPTDTSEAGLETLICRALTGSDCMPRPAGTPAVVAETPAPYGGVGWLPGDPADYDREYCVDLVQLRAFLHSTQPEVAEALDLDSNSPTRRKFLARLQGEVSKRGVVDVLRNGLQHGPHRIELFYGTPSPGNEKARALFEQNRFTVTRQLRYSSDETQRALDLVLFINGLPVFTFELKNRLTKQTVHDAIEQYRRDRTPRERLFELGRCIAHFAVDDSEVWFCTHLQGKASWFLPFNKGWNDGAGNPPNPQGLKTDYLWREVLTRESLTNILENYAQLVEEKDPRTGKKRRRQIFPRYHQLDVVRKLLADVREHGAGRRYLIQHSAGSGKSNSIVWLAHQLIGVAKDGSPVFDSIIVVTDRRIKAYLEERKSPYRAIVAFSGEYEYGGVNVTEARLISIFLEFLVPKLPAPKEEDLSRGILKAIDMDSYRVEKQASMRIALPDADAEIEPVPTAGGGHKPEPELDRLSNIIKAFNDQFGNIPWSDADRVRRLITEEIPARVAADMAYQNAMKNSDRQNARIEHDKALLRVIVALLADDTELFKQFSDNESFRRWLSNMVFALTYGEPGRAR